MGITVTRRSFMAAAGSLLLLPKMLVRPKVTTDHLVKRFCDKPDCCSRWKIDEPFVMEGHGYGTDGRAIIRAEKAERDTTAEGLRIPPATQAFSQLWVERGPWRRLPRESFVVERYGICPDCYELIRECPHCDGEGCEACHYHGEVGNEHCPTCGGKSFDGKPCLQPFGDKLIAGHMFRRLQAIPGVMWNQGSLERNDFGHMARNPYPILFKSDIGVEGMVMPVETKAC
ncbi:MAG: hypothetical protein WCX88_03285 [Patescibacteria group bacterium]